MNIVRVTYSIRKRNIKISVSAASTHYGRWHSDYMIQIFADFSWKFCYFFAEILRVFVHSTLGLTVYAQLTF